jgi:uncharacterized membrane protein
VGALLAALSAVVYGSADFLGGLASRRAPATTVTVTSQLAGLLVLVIAVPLVGGHGPLTHAIGIGALGGLAGGLGVMLLYRGLAVGTMSIVSPVTAVCAALVPLVVGLALGERPGALALVGVVCSVIAIVLVSLVPGEGGQRDARAVVLIALAAGVCFGGFYVALAKAGRASGLWPLVGARPASIGIALLLARVRREPALVPRVGAATAVATGLLDMTANVLFLEAARHGQLAVVGVLGSLYPVSTVVLARTIGHERLRAVQIAGLALAVAGLVLTAV